MFICKVLKINVKVIFKSFQVLMSFFYNKNTKSDKIDKI